jgi:hypothetical protein
LYRVEATFREHADVLSAEVEVLQAGRSEITIRAGVGEAATGSISFAKPELAHRRILARLCYNDGLAAIKKVAIEGSSYRIEHLRQGWITELTLQREVEPEGEQERWVLSESLGGFAIQPGENVIKLGIVSARRGGD